MTNQECSICCEKYNKSTHAMVVCEFGDCGFTSCKACVRTYLLGTTLDPHCMNCKKSWNEKFLVNNLNRAFCEKDYKNHRKQLLIDREMSRLPETMHLAERQKKIDVQEKKEQEITLNIKNLTKQLNLYKNERSRISHNIYHIRHGTDNDGETPERRKFIMACPTDHCRGFLSTQYKCELCELFTCPHCFEVIGHSKTDPHECNPDSVASADMIKKDTKPCPSCGVRIFKISGCSQMWCTECKVAFDYNTGKIDTGVVHNPHYYAHIAAQNQGQAPRNPQDILCGGLISLQRLHNLLHTVKEIMSDDDEYMQISTYLFAIHRVISHITYSELPHNRRAVRELEDGEDIRIKYILGKASKKEIGDQVYRRDIKRKKQTEQLHLYEILGVVGTENFNMIVDMINKYIKDRNNIRKNPDLYKSYTPGGAASIAIIDEINKKIVIMDNLKDYCNSEFIKISVTYNNKVMCIDDLWKLSTKKYKISDIKASS